MPEAALPPFLAFGPDDIRRAHAAWGCNCGPAALAACLGRTLDAVRPHLGAFEVRRYMNPTMMSAAVISAGFDPLKARPGKLPVHGLVRIQWGGPWLRLGVPSRAAYRRTHWVAIKQADGIAWVYDVNDAAWQGLDTWRSGTATVLLDDVKGGDGTYAFTHCWEVRKRKESDA